MKIEEITINAAFYELFENIFGEDFFGVITSLKSTPRIKMLRNKNAEELTEEENDELMEANLAMAAIMKKYTSRIAYIGNKLYKKQYTGSYDDYVKFLAECDSGTFLDPDFIAAIWKKITDDQTIPKSVKNV